MRLLPQPPSSLLRVFSSGQGRTALLKNCERTALGNDSAIAGPRACEVLDSVVYMESRLQAALCHWLNLRHGWTQPQRLSSTDNSTEPTSPDSAAGLWRVVSADRRLGTLQVEGAGRSGPRSLTKLRVPEAVRTALPVRGGSLLCRGA